MSGIEGGIDRDDPFYDCILALYGQMTDRMGSAVLIDPTHALSILHCFVNATGTMSVNTALSRKKVAIKKIILQDRSEYDCASGAYPHIKVPDDCHDQIVLLELSDPLPGPFAQVSTLAADFDGTLRVACEDRLSKPAPHVRTARVEAIGDACAGVLAVKEAQPGSGFPTESGAPAMMLMRNGQLSVVGIQSGSDDMVKAGEKPSQSRPQAKAYATFVKVSSAIMDLIGRSRTASAAARARQNAAAPAPAQRLQLASAAVRAAASSATAAGDPPPTFRLVKGGQAQRNECFCEIPDARVFDGIPWSFLAMGYDGIFESGDGITIQGQSQDSVQFTSTRANGVGSATQVDHQVFTVGGINGGRHWLYAEFDFLVDSVPRTFMVYLFHVTDDPETPDVPRRFRIEAFRKDGGNLGHLPSNCTVAPGCSWPFSSAEFIDFVRLPPGTGLRQDDVGTGHEHN